MNKPLRLLSISDIHLGHPKTATDFIITNLMRYWPSSADMANIDIIILAGDIFDRLLDFNSPSAFEIKRWMYWVIDKCKRHNIILRVLEGTPSHDHCQNRWWLEANKDKAVDLAYIDILKIEHIDKLDIDILWIPDEWKANTDDIWLDAKTELSKHALDQVDFTVIHGTMDHQVPHGVHIPHHITQRYLDITRHYVLTGHIHQCAVKDRCLTNGSFDRLCHGDEGKKGYWDITIKDSGDDIVFIENINAKVYKTIDLTGIGDNIKEVIDEKIKGIPEDSFIRILTDKGSSVLASFEMIRSDYSQFKWSIKTHKDDKDGIQANLLKDTRSQLEQRYIGKDNIFAIIQDRLKDIDPLLRKECETLLRIHI